MALQNKRRLLLAKIETTYGTDPTPTGGANAILLKGNPVLTPLDAEIVDRDILRAYLGSSEQIIAAYSAKLEFEVEIAGAGAAGTVPAYGPLLRMCAHAETISAGVSVSYRPISGSFESGTLWFQLPDDTSPSTSPLHKIVGARGNVMLMFNAKGVPFMKFTMTGLYVAVLDATVPACTYTGFKTPVAVNKANTTFSFFSYAAKMASFELDAGNEVVYRNLVNEERVMIVDRKGKGSTTFDAPTITAKDFFSASLVSTLGAVSLVHGVGAGNIFEVASSTVDLTNPTYGDDNNIATMTMPHTYVPTTAGNDEYVLTVR
jgi:hypothetical protein